MTIGEQIDRTGERRTLVPLLLGMRRSWMTSRPK